MEQNREDQRRRAHTRLEGLLLEGLEGEPRRWTDADWDDMRRRYEERHPDNAGSSAIREG
jgi:hypothetical protein